jgi:hypothetical protein
VATGALQLVFNLTLQTITHLPPRDKRLDLRQFRSLGARLSKLSEPLRGGFSELDLHRYFGADVDKILHLPDELKYVGRILSELPSSRQSVIRIDSPNPQIRLATYLTAWVEAGSGKKHYEDLQELIGAAFVARGTSAPAWTERLGIEMHRKLKLRREWRKPVAGCTV